MNIKFLLVLMMFAIQGIIGYAKAADTEVETDSVSHFIVWGHDDSQLGFYGLTDKPIVTHDDGYLTVSLRNGDSVEFSSTQVKKFTLGIVKDEETGVADVEKNAGEVKNVGGLLVFKMFTPGSSVQIYAVNGTMFFNDTIGADGSLIVEISEYPSGVYVIKTESLTCKIVKK